MSLVPANALTSPPPTVDTITLGTPTGNSRIARWWPARCRPLPPMPMMPSRRPSPCSRLTTAASPRAMVAIASSLCPPDARCARSPPRGRAHLRTRHVRRECRLSHHSEVHHQGVRPGPLDQFLDEREVRPLGIQRPDQHYRIGHRFPPAPTQPQIAPSGKSPRKSAGRLTAGRGPSGSGCGRRSAGSLPGAWRVTWAHKASSRHSHASWARRMRLRPPL